MNLNFTDTARERILHFLEAQKDQGVSALRLAGTRAEQKLWLVKPDDRQETDRIFDAGGFEVFADPASADNFDGAVVDFVQGLMQSGFRVYHPSPSWDDPMEQKVQDVLDTVINPGVASHGGVVELDGVKDGIAVIRFGGGCQGCAASTVTLKHGVERTLLDSVEGLQGVQDATDHASGTNPYYASSGSGSSPFGS
ncbi:MAG TPA: NifU family protein [Deinococcales bacterium]|nr:NifU family protein [Deinococcales bacterium]